MRKTAARDMVRFVERLAHYARVTKHHPDFAIFPQNGAPLGKYPDYMATVTGLGQEDTWYNGNAKSPWTAETVPWLKKFIAAGKLVLCTDYCRKQALIDDFYAKAKAIGAVPYATRRDLDKLVINPGHAPD